MEEAAAGIASVTDVEGVAMGVTGVTDMARTAEVGVVAGISGWRVMLNFGNLGLVFGRSCLENRVCIMFVDWPAMTYFRKHDPNG